MRIGQMVSNMMMISRYQNMNAEKLHDANMEMATGKRVNSAADDPSAIGRIQRTKAQINESQITQRVLEDKRNQNAMVEASLTAMGDASKELASLAVKEGTPGADTASIEAKAKSLLDSMVKIQSETTFNGANPFTDGSSPSFTIKANETDPTTYDITLNDGTTLTGKSVSDIVDSSFIKENISGQISEARSAVGVETNILEFRSSYEKTRESVLTKSLSNIQDADLDESAIKASIATQMIQANQQLLAKSTNMMARQIGSAFDVRV